MARQDQRHRHRLGRPPDVLGPSLAAEDRGAALSGLGDNAIEGGQVRPGAPTRQSPPNNARRRLHRSGVQGLAGTPGCGGGVGTVDMSRAGLGPLAVRRLSGVEVGIAAIRHGLISMMTYHGTLAIVAPPAQ